MIKMQCITIDCADPAALADFWSKVLDWKIGGEGDEVWIKKISKRAKQLMPLTFSFYATPIRKQLRAAFT